MTDDSTLRSAYEELLAARMPRDRSACPPTEALLGVVDRQGSEDARLATIDHALGCVACRSDLDLLRAAAGAARGSLEGPGTGDPVVLPFGSRSRGMSLRALATAAGLMFAVGIGVIAIERDRAGSGVPRMRGPNVAALSLIPPIHTAEGNVRLQWHRVPNTVQYRVDVFDAGGRPLSSDVVTDTTFLLIGATNRGDQRPLRYMVTAVQSDATELSSEPGVIVP